MMRRRGAADADAAAQHHRHLQPPGGHVLDLGHLVDHLAETIEREIEEHEIDHRARAGHGRAGAHADEPALHDRGVAQPLRTIFLIQPEGGIEVAAALADAFADSAFVERFLAKGRMRALLEDLPVYLVLDDHAGLWGSASYAATRGQVNT